MPASSRLTLAGRALLEVHGLEVHYGGIRAVKGIDFEVAEGELVCLIGANGAGKTSTLKAITGTQAWAGEIDYMKQTTRGQAPYQLLARGLAMVPEGRGVFARMSVTENLQMGASVADVAHFEEDLARVFQLFPRLRERLHQRGGTLSGGEQQMLAISRALMSRPRLLLLDEPSLGLAPLLVQQIFSAIRKLNGRDKLTVFLVEQNAFHALKLAHRGYVMINGQITLSGAGRELLKRPEIRAAYLEGSRIEQAQGKK